jgi:hypothetical protein
MPQGMVQTCHKAWFKHAFSNITDNFTVGLPAMLLVMFACEGPGLHDEGSDFAGGEHWAFFHLRDLDFGDGLGGA